MENEFEKYLQQNRGLFEKGLASPRVWEKLQRDLIEYQTRRHRVIRMRRISLSIAACILLCIGATLVIFKIKNQPDSNAITRNVTYRDSMIDMQKIAAEKMERDSADRVAGIANIETRQSLYHYSQLIESRQKQMAALRHVNPDLYARSQKVLTDLNQVYGRLQKQLPGSPDQQKVLKALIQNLKMQEQILNNQLQLLEELQNTATDGEKIKI